MSFGRIEAEICDENHFDIRYYVGAPGWSQFWWGHYEIEQNIPALTKILNFLKSPETSTKRLGEYNSKKLPFFHRFFNWFDSIEIIGSVGKISHEKEFIEFCFAKDRKKRLFFYAECKAEPALSHYVAYVSMVSVENAIEKIMQAKAYADKNRKPKDRVSEIRALLTDLKKPLI